MLIAQIQWRKLQSLIETWKNVKQLSPESVKESKVAPKRVLYCYRIISLNNLVAKSPAGVQ